MIKSREVRLKMKTINLKCGHKIKVAEWPSQEGLKKVREHYKKHHPKMMKAITKKALKTKLSKGIIKHIKSKPDSLGQYTHILSKTPSGWDYQVFRGATKIGSGSAKTKPEASKQIAGVIVKKHNPIKKKKVKKVVNPPIKKKKKTSKYADNSIVLFKSTLRGKNILFGIVKSASKDRDKGTTKYVIQWYSISKKLNTITENESTLNQSPVIYIPDKKKQDNLIKFIPQIIKAFQLSGTKKPTFIKRLQDVVGLTKTQANKVCTKLKEIK